MTTAGTDTRETADAASVYNYSHFCPVYYDFRTFDGPKPGETAPDFDARTPDGERVRLSDFEGWVVLETGSITCPITDSKVHAMDELQRNHDDVTFLLLYTREAQPGETYDSHETFAEKLDRARTFVAGYDVERTVLVDDQAGTAHRQLGGMPNSVHVINPNGVVVMRGDWNDVRIMKQVLATRNPNGLVERESYRGRPLFFTLKKGILRVLLDAGPRALWDFLRHAPTFALMHLKREFRGKDAGVATGRFDRLRPGLPAISRAVLGQSSVRSVPGSPDRVDRLVVGTSGHDCETVAECWR
jgi:hypothetical protein